MRCTVQYCTIRYCAAFVLTMLLSAKAEQGLVECTTDKEIKRGGGWMDGVAQWRCSLSSLSLSFDLAPLLPSVTPLSPRTSLKGYRIFNFFCYCRFHIKRGQPALPWKLFQDGRRFQWEVHSHTEMASVFSDRPSPNRKWVIDYLT